MYKHESPMRALDSETLNYWQGWMYKKQSSSMLGIHQWQKRWFVISQTVDAAKYEASMHNNWSISSLVIQVNISHFSGQAILMS